MKINPMLMYDAELVVFVGAGVEVHLFSFE